MKSGTARAAFGWAMLVVAGAPGSALAETIRPVTCETRGATVAEQVCAACHAVGVVGESRNPSAPPLRILRKRFDTIGLERELMRMSREGHAGMAGGTIAEADVSELAAYIQSLRPWR